MSTSNSGKKEINSFFNLIFFLICLNQAKFACLEVFNTRMAHLIVDYQMQE